MEYIDKINKCDIIISSFFNKGLSVRERQVRNSAKVPGVFGIKEEKLYAVSNHAGA